jgi:hypothetical protein
MILLPAILPLTTLLSCPNVLCCVVSYPALLALPLAHSLAHSLTHQLQDGVVKAVATQLNPPSWGLDRIDDTKGLDKSYDYIYTGAGVHAYVLDTPMNNQAEFGGRYLSCTSYVTAAPCSVAAIEDHGSHVAGE